MTHGVDEDADGKAELIFVGKYKFDGAGNVLCLLEGKVAGNDDHTDLLAIGEANPNNPGFEVAEVGATGSGIFSARTCKKLWNGNLHQTQKSTMADLYPQYPGAEILFAQRPVCANNRCDDRIYQILKGDGTLLKQYASFGTGVGSMPIANTNLDMKGGDEVLTSNGTFIRKGAAIALSNAWQKPYTGVNTHVLLLNILGDDRPELIGHGSQSIFVMQVQ